MCLCQQAQLSHSPAIPAQEKGGMATGKQKEAACVRKRIPKGDFDQAKSPRKWKSAIKPCTPYLRNARFVETNGILAALQ